MVLLSCVVAVATSAPPLVAQVSPVVPEVDSMLVAATAAVIRSQWDSVSRLHFVAEQPLYTALGLSSADVNALRSRLPTTVVIADSAPAQPCTIASGYRCSRISFDGLARVGETWTFTLTRSLVNGCGYDGRLVDVELIDGELAVTGSRYGGSGSCGPTRTRLPFPIPPDSAGRPPF